MPRIARVVVPDTPHHVTQRGNRRQRTFFIASDYSLYKDLLATWCSRHGVSVWAYCLMPNHVHLILTPSRSGGLARAVGEAHRRYTLAINTRERWKGFLWQGRFASYPMDADYTINAARYLLLNPVRAKLVREVAEWPHSSFRAHVTGQGDGLVDPVPLNREIRDWDEFLKLESSNRVLHEIRSHQRTGRPLGSKVFVRRLEVALERPLLPRKSGRRPKKQ